MNWNFSYTARREAAELSPSQRRDSVLLRTRAPQVLDSLTKAGFDTAAIRQVRAQVGLMVNPPAGGAAAFGGRGGGGGGRGGAGGGQDCAHPTTQWETFCARPAEAPGGRGGRGGGAAPADSAVAAATAPVPAAANQPNRGGRAGRGAAAAANEDVPPTTRIWQLIGVTPPAIGGGRGGGGGGGFAAFAGGLPQTAGTGDYLVTMTVNGQTYKQVFRVERVSGGGDSVSPFGQDETDHRGVLVQRVPKLR